MSISSDNVQLVKDLQRCLNLRHGQRLSEDGHGGNRTRAALARALPGFGEEAITLPLPTASGSGPGGAAMPVDLRSAGNIATLHSRVQPLARQLIAEAAAKGIQIKVISGTRSYAEQDALYRKAVDGLDNDGDGRIDEADERVTKARGGYSNHNFGIALDIGIFEGKAYVPESPLYAQVGKIGKALGFEWGGDWTSFKDMPHFQLRPAWAKGMREATMLAELRRRVAAGEALF